MTESEWLECSDPPEMLRHLGNQYSLRKRRLFACACCRQAWGLIKPSQQLVVEAAERVADGLLDVAEARKSHPHRFPDGPIAAEATAPNSAAGWCLADRLCAMMVQTRLRDVVPAALRANLLRDNCGDPFRLPPFVCFWEREGRALWLTSDVLSLAQAAYEERQPETGELDFDRLAILADALEDAGCTEQALRSRRLDVDLLWHLKGRERCPNLCDHGLISPQAEGEGWDVCHVCKSTTGTIPLSGPHARGCWVLDLLLGKE
jgi:hypothetical protein